MTDAQLYLDGYRLGLGAAIRGIDRARTAISASSTIPDEAKTVCLSVLIGLTNGLRIVSASATVEEL